MILPLCRLVVLCLFSLELTNREYFGYVKGRLPTNNETGDYNIVNHILTNTDVKEISNNKMMLMIQQHEHV